MVAQRIADYLDGSGITKAWLAKQIGMTDATLNRKLSGESKLYVSEYKDICDALKVKYGTFMD